MKGTDWNLPDLRDRKEAQGSSREDFGVAEIQVWRGVGEGEGVRNKED